MWFLKRQPQGGRSKRSQTGFTLIELLLTMLILGIAVAGIGSLYYATKVAQVRSQHLDLATRAARTEIEQLRNNGYSTLDPGSTVDFTSALPASLPLDRSGTVVVSEPLNGLRRVDVTVKYTDQGKPMQVTLSSNIGVIGIGQGQ